MSVNLETFAPTPNVAGGKSSHGGYCGPAVKPIALHLVSSVAKKVKIPIVGIGGIGNWIDAAEHIALGASTVQVCTAAMHYGFRIVEDMADGLTAYMDDHGYRSIDDFRPAAPSRTCWTGATWISTTKSSPRFTPTFASAASSATSLVKTVRTSASNARPPKMETASTTPTEWKFCRQVRASSKRNASVATYVRSCARWTVRHDAAD